MKRLVKTTSERRNDGEPAAGGKRPYERPRILSVEKLEAVAAICTGLDPKADGFACPSGNIQS